MRDLYDKCFNVDGTVKVCGRDHCKTLIEACQQMKPNVDFGNVDTGMMNVNNINHLMQSIDNEK